MCRVLAVVSVEGGPSRESLDCVFNLLKGNMISGEEGESGENDEEPAEPLDSDEVHQYCIFVCV